ANLPESAFSSILVDNLHSISKDHGQYWFNNEQFLSRVTSALHGLIGSKDFIPMDDVPANDQQAPIDEQVGAQGLAPLLTDGQVLKTAAAKRRIRAFLYMATGLLSILEIPLLCL